MNRKQTAVYVSRVDLRVEFNTVTESEFNSRLLTSVGDVIYVTAGRL